MRAQRGHHMVRSDTFLRQASPGPLLETMAHTCGAGRSVREWAACIVVGAMVLANVSRASRLLLVS